MVWVCEQHYEELYRYAWRKCGDADSARDLVHVVLEETMKSLRKNLAAALMLAAVEEALQARDVPKAWKSAGMFAPPRPLLFWLLKKRLLDQYKFNARYNEVEVGDEFWEAVACTDLETIDVATILNGFFSAPGRALVILSKHITEPSRQHVERLLALLDREEQSDVALFTAWFLDNPEALPALFVLCPRGSQEKLMSLFVLLFWAMGNSDADVSSICGIPYERVRKLREKTKEFWTNVMDFIFNGDDARVRPPSTVSRSRRNDDEV